jgi:cell division protein FtsB
MNKEGKFISVIIKVGLIVGVAALVFVLFRVYEETQKKRQIQDMINQLQSEADRIDRENKRMKENLEFLSSADYLEIEAKDKLNQKNPDEEVIVLKTNVAQETALEENPEPQKNETVAVLANHVKWWNYFFKY